MKSCKAKIVKICRGAIRFIMSLLDERTAEQRQLKTETVYINEWDADVIVRELTGLERAEIESSPPSSALLVSKCVVDKRGNNIFTDKDIPTLEQKSSTALEKIGNVTRRLSGMDADYINGKIDEIRDTAMTKFYFSLAIKLGYNHPDNLLSGLTSRQVSDLLAYSVLDPFNEERADYRIAKLMSLYVNSHKGKNTPASKPTDFMPDYGSTPETRRKKLVEDQKDILMAVVAATKGNRSDK